MFGQWVKPVVQDTVTDRKRMGTATLAQVLVVERAAVLAR